MVGSFGMGSSLVSYDAADNGAHSAPNIVAKVLSNEDAKKEVDTLLKLHRDQIAYLLEANRDLVEALRDALLEREEILGDDILAAIAEAEARRPAQASSATRVPIPAKRSSSGIAASTCDETSE